MHSIDCPASSYYVFTGIINHNSQQRDEMIYNICIITAKVVNILHLEAYLKKYSYM